MHEQPAQVPEAMAVALLLQLQLHIASTEAVRVDWSFVRLSTWGVMRSGRGQAIPRALLVLPQCCGLDCCRVGAALAWPRRASLVCLRSDAVPSKT